MYRLLTFYYSRLALKRGKSLAAYGLALCLLNLPYLAQADTLFASANTTTKVAGWGCYYTSTGESAGTGNFSVVTQPAHGVLSFGTGLSNGIYNGKRIPVAVAYYTWTDTNTQADQDNFALHWQQAGLQGCNIDDSLRIQKVAAPKNLGRAADCPKACEGNPIDTATGNKFQTETDFSAPAHTGLEFTRFYNSQANHTPVLGGWRSNWSATLNYDEAAGEVVATRADGRRETFRRQSDGAWQADPDVVDRLHPVPDNGRQTGWLLVTNDDASETYDLDGHLLSVRLRGGQPTVLSYDSLGRMVKIGGYFGHALSLGYDAGGRLTTVTAPDGKAYKYAYDTNGNLASVTYPDLSRRKYVYEDANFPHSLTGIVDENNKRYASWSYDAKGRAVSSQHAGGVELTTVAYLDNGDSQVTDAMNNSHVYQFAHQFDMVKPSSVSGVAAKNLGYKTLSYDANGFVAEASDFNGNVTRYRRDTSGLELFRTEAAGTPSERTIATQWHESLRLPVSITAPDKTTNFSYDADGRLIWRSESDGEQSREWQYRFTENGLLASIDGPRKDVEDITVFGYDESGNLKTVDNALGQRSEFQDYDTNGRPLSMRDANGLETRWTYDARGRVISKQVGGVLTQYQRDAVGQVVKIIEADGSYLALTYDDAYRLIRVGDSGGNRIEYRLDANGNRLEQTVYDVDNQLRQTLSQRFDALGRLSANLGADKQTTSVEYDDNDNVRGTTDPLNHKTKYAYDELNRLVRSIDGEGNAVSAAYDAGDRLQAVTDALGHSTQYRYDGLGNRRTVDSPDSGVSEYRYDAAGNLVASVNARGQSVEYRYDALNRLTEIRDGEGMRIHFAFDQGDNGLGRLTQMSDVFGSSAWRYDREGRVIAKTFASGSLNLGLQYTYAADGHLASLRYPSGRVVGFEYRNGLVNALKLDGHSLVSDIVHQPFGLPRQWLFVNGATVQRDFDADGRLAAYDLGEQRRELVYDIAGRLEAYRDSDMRYDQNFAHDAANRLMGFGWGSAKSEYRYDANGNRIELADESGSSNYRIDENGNRLLDIRRNGQLQQALSYDAAGNLVTDGRRQFSYDGRGRLVKASGTFGQEYYKINGLGQRIAKVHRDGLDLAGDADSDGTLTAADLRLIVLMSKGGTASNPAADCNRDGRITAADASCAQAKIADMRAHPGNYVVKGLYFVYDEAGHLLGEYNHAGNAIQETVWLGDIPVAVLKDDQVFYVHADHLGAPRAINDAAGKTVWRWDSEPFGGNPADEDPDGDGVKFVYNLRFSGHYYDQTTGLHYNGFRDYDPKIGRYIESDPIGLAGGVNTYTYVGNQLLNAVDPFGLDEINFHDPNEQLDILFIAIPNNYEISNYRESKDGWFNVSGHGNPYMMVQNGNRLSANQLANLIKSHPKYRKNSKVKLISCNVGKRPDNAISAEPFAQYVAEALGSNPVYAADTYVFNPGAIPLPGISPLRWGEYKVFGGNSIGGMQGQ